MTICYIRIQQQGGRLFPRRGGIIMDNRIIIMIISLIAMIIFRKRK